MQLVGSLLRNTRFSWIPAFAGITKCEGMTKCDNVPFFVIPFFAIPDLIGNLEDGNAPLFQRAVKSSVDDLQRRIEGVLCRDAAAQRYNKETI